MEEEATPSGGPEGGSKPPPNAPAFFVILHPSQGDSSKEEGILVANKDASSVAPVITTGPKDSKSDFFHSANCTSGEITVTLDNNNMWNEFYRCSTEMVLTKQGRRMFPYCRYSISGLDPYLKYILLMDITPLDNIKYKWNGKWWEHAGKADPHVLGRVFLHPESPSTGQYWMHQPVSFYKLKLTNNILDQEGHTILHSMHRYLPRLHVVPAEKVSEVIQLNGPDVHTFTFPQTEFIAVTAYQNFQITQLKIDCNPFAKGFREGMVTGRPMKDMKHKPTGQEADSSISINENEDSAPMMKLQELFKLSEYLDGPEQTETFNSVEDFIRFTKAASEQEKNAKQNEDVVKRLNEPPAVASLSKPTEQPSVKIKMEPEDDYDYTKALEDVAVKQEQFDYSSIDIDYPILEKHFAKFKEDPYLDGNHFVSSPMGVAKVKLKVEQDNMYLEPNNLEVPDVHQPGLSEDTLEDTKVHISTNCTESLSAFTSPSVTSVGHDVHVREKRKRISKKKIDEIYATLQTALRISRGPKRKLPSLFPKPSVTPGIEGTVASVAKKRGRPPKPKIAKVGRPPKKDNPIEAPPLFPEFNPDLEDVDGVLFVAFSSKEALYVHTGKKPTDTVPASLPTPEATPELADEMQKILGLEKQLLSHLKMMKHRQVIHPALQQVGIKLNIVDPAMSIDLRYLGVELPLLYVPCDAEYVDNGLSAQGLPFVSRTGKTTDYTKIKGWRDKFSTESTTSSQKIDAGRSESTVKNLSAFCSDELDEYLEKEAKLMGDLNELTENEPASVISYQLPTKSSSYVRTLDSVLKKQAQQTTSSLNATEQLPVPRKKRKYTRRVPLLKANSKPKHILPFPITSKPCSAGKKGYSPSHIVNKAVTPSSNSVECVSQPVVKPLESQQSEYEGGQQIQMQSQQIDIKPIWLSKAQMKIKDLEEPAVWEGKPRTYITEERADISLSTLLTAQVSLKNRPIQRLFGMRTNLCDNDFCRLGCICSSLNSPKEAAAAHCGHETCMFSSTCLKKVHIEKDGSSAEASETAQDEGNDCSSLSVNAYQPVQPEHRVESLGVKQTERQEMFVDGLHDRATKAKKRKADEGNARLSDVWTPIRFRIWDKSDVADDPEPLCIPEAVEFVEPRILPKGHMEKSKFPVGSKVGRPSAVAQVHPEDPIYLHFDSMMTCARVRPFQPKVPEEKKKKKGHRTRGSVKKPDIKLNKAKVRQKEDHIKNEKKSEIIDSNGPTKGIEIISNCSQEKDNNKVLNITSQHMTSSKPQSFKLGGFNIELLEGSKSGEKSTSGTLCSRVKIAMSAEKRLKHAPQKPKSVKRKVVSVKTLDQELEDDSGDEERKYHERKGLPFYSKVIPAGKIVTRLKTSDINEGELVEVNGKNYSQAKLLLGNMGALHPANRLAAYITRRLKPSLFSLSKVKEATAKLPTKSPPIDLTIEEKSKDTLISEPSKTAAQPRPSSMFTQFVMGEVGAMQKSDGVSSTEPTILGSSNVIQSPQLQVVSSSVAEGKQAPAITAATSSSFTSLTSLSSTSLSSDDLSTASPSKDKATPLPTIRVTKLVTKDSSVSVPTGIVTANDAHAMAPTSVPSNKDTVLKLPILSPAVVKPIASTGNTSLIPLFNNPTVNKSIVTSIPNLLATPSVQLGTVAPQLGLNIASSMNVKTVTVKAVSAASPGGGASGPEKRLGPRLLLIPVNSASAPARPPQTVQSQPGQKMVLQPIKAANGVTLFRHPNGQIIQLVPLQTTSANINSSQQQTVFQNPGPVTTLRLPFLPNPKAAAATCISIPTNSIPPAPAPAISPVVSSPKITLNKSGVIIFPQTPPKVSPLDTLAVKATPPTSNSEAAPSIPQIRKYTVSGQYLIPSNPMPRKSEALSLANVPPPVLQNNSPVNPATKPNIILMGDKPGTMSDLEKQDRKPSDSSSDSNREKNKKDVKECEEQPTLENDEHLDGIHKSTKEEIKCVNQQVNTLAKDEQCRNRLQENERFCLNVITIDDEFFDSDVDKGDSQQSPAVKNTNSQVKAGDSSPATSVPAYVQERAAAGEQQNIMYKNGAKAELSIEHRSSKPQFSEASSNQKESLQVDSHTKQAIFDREIHSLQTDDESDDDYDDDYEDEDNDSVDIESVEEVSEKKNSAHLKESDDNTSKKCGTQRKFSKGRNQGSKSEDDESVDIETVEELSGKRNLDEDKNGQGKLSTGIKKFYKVNGENIISVVAEVPYSRRNHTANERKRRSELKALFQGLGNAVGLHNLPKVSKSYILTKAIEEVEGLTDTADTLLKKKTLLSQAQTQLIKKVSNLSGKPREVVLKKFEYLYAKQKAMEAENKTQNLEEDVVQETSTNLPLSKSEPFLPLKLAEETNESSKTKKPNILARKPMLLTKEEKQQQPGVSSEPTSTILVAPAGQVGKQEHGIAGQVAGTTPTLIQAQLSPAQMKSGVTSVLIQLPNTIQLNNIIGNSHVPVSLSTVSGSDVCTTTPSDPLSDDDDLSMMPRIVNVRSLTPGASADLANDDDLSMMPRIVNVRSLASGSSSDLASMFEIDTTDTERECKSDAHSLRTLSYISSNASVEDPSYVTIQSTFSPLDKMKESLTDPERKSCSPYSNLVDNLTQENNVSTEASLKSEHFGTNNTSSSKMDDDVGGSRLDLDLKKLTSAIDEAGLEPSELSDTMADPEDETLTSLLDEIAFLNQQLNTDTVDLESVNNFPGLDSASRSVSKLADGDSSPFSFGRFKEVPDAKEKNISFSPLFMQLEEGEIPDSSKHSEEAGIVVFEGGAIGTPSQSNVVEAQTGSHQSPATISAQPLTEKPVSSCSDVFWRPMPKLAPLGLKSHTVTSDQRVLASKSMPSLASVAMRPSSPKTTD